MIYAYQLGCFYKKRGRLYWADEFDPHWIDIFHEGSFKHAFL